MCTKANMTPDAVLSMDIALFLGLRKEFFIQDLQATKEGREALNNAERYERKNADISKVKAIIGIKQGKKVIK